MTSSKSDASFIALLSIFSRLQLSVLKIAKRRNEKSCSASKYGSNAVFRISVDDVIKQLRPIYSDVVYMFDGRAFSFEISKKS